MIPFKVVIPARYASTRLPGKPLLDLADKPMIVHVCEQALAAKAQQIVVATDDVRIYDQVKLLGIQVLMTDKHHQSGTERLAEVAEKLHWDQEDIIVNLQGDEPLIPPLLIQTVACALANQHHAGIATLATPMDEKTDIFNSNVVKVVTDRKGYALYFSRAPIPWDRKNFSGTSNPLTSKQFYLRHIGLYAYNVDFLRRYCQWTPSPLEQLESLEQLRILWQGEPILVKEITNAPEAGIDTREDLARVRRHLLKT